MLIVRLPCGRSSGAALYRDITIEAGVSGAVDLSHPYRSEEGQDLVGAEARSGVECHSSPTAI